MKKWDHNKILKLHPGIKPEDLQGNNGIGRYVFLCGSAGRSKLIGERFNELEIRYCPFGYGYDLYFGKIDSSEGQIDVAAASTGVGCPSADIIINQLYANGARRFLRVGTAGSLQPNSIKVGSTIIATAAVRDESTSSNYVHISYPAIASAEMVSASLKAAEMLNMLDNVYHGIVHTKDSLFAREFGFSNLKSSSEYMESIKQSGVLASEMECAHIFILTSLLNYQSTDGYACIDNNVFSGAVLAIVGDDDPVHNDINMIEGSINKAIDLGFETIRNLFAKEKR